MVQVKLLIHTEPMLFTHVGGRPPVKLSQRTRRGLVKGPDMHTVKIAVVLQN